MALNVYIINKIRSGKGWERLLPVGLGRGTKKHGIRIGAPKIKALH